MSTSNISIRIDSELKENANALFKKLGLNMTTAISIFLQMSINNEGLPFNVTLKPNSATKEAFKEAAGQRSPVLRVAAGRPSAPSANFAGEPADP